jgi:hypothetical protein
LYQIELIKIVLPSKEGLTVYHLRHDATDGPDIDGCVVVLFANEELWSSVPSGCYVVRHFACGWHDASETQIADFDLIMLTDEKILRFNISMNDIEIMHICNTFKHLVGKMFDFGCLNDKNRYS